MMRKPYIAKLKGQPVTELPENLYIPPEALEVFLEMFEGPLDLLLYLIRKQDINILDIPIAKITQQYMDYIELMQAFEFDLASDYLAMAAMLAEIKSRMLLPRPPLADETNEADPRAALVRKLQLYEQLKEASRVLDEQPRLQRDTHPAQAAVDHLAVDIQRPALTWQGLMEAFQKLLNRLEVKAPHQVERPHYSVDSRIAAIRRQLQTHRFLSFQQCFDLEEGPLGVVVSLMSILELLRQSVIEIIQTQPLEPFYLRAVD